MDLETRYTREQFKEILRKYRHDAGWTQEDMVYNLGGVSIDTYRRWEQGRQMPKSRAIINKLYNMRVLT